MTNIVTQFIQLAQFLVGKSPDSSEGYKDQALLIVYPDYPIDTDSWYGYTEQVGHAGVLLIKHTGLTKYYEFGRYKPAGKRGMVRNKKISDVQISSDGSIVKSTLKKVLRELARKSGKKTRIRAARFIQMNFDDMLAYAKKQQPEYDILSFNCGIYAETVILKGNPRVDRPSILIPAPNNIVDEYIEEGNAEITYSYNSDTILIGEGDETDAKN